jgi:hypothetical protein
MASVTVYEKSRPPQSMEDAIRRRDELRIMVKEIGDKLAKRQIPQESKFKTERALEWKNRELAYLVTWIAKNDPDAKALRIAREKEEASRAAENARKRSEANAAMDAARELAIRKREEARERHRLAMEEKARAQAQRIAKAATLNAVDFKDPDTLIYASYRLLHGLHSRVEFTDQEIGTLQLVLKYLRQKGVDAPS